jgi:predicted GTPase
MGYGEEQVRDLQATIDRVPCEVVVIGTPIDLNRVVRLRQPTVRVRYELQELGQPTLDGALETFVRGVVRRSGAVAV